MCDDGIFGNGTCYSCIDGFCGANCELICNTTKVPILPTVLNGTILFNSSFSQTGPILITQQGNLILNNAHYTLGDVNVQGYFSLYGNVTISINGSLVLYPTSHLVINVQQQNPTIYISNCATLSGVLEIQIPPSQNEPLSWDIIYTPCVNGSFSEIQVVGNNGCPARTNVQYLHSFLTVSLSFPSCDTGTAVAIQYWVWIIVGVTILVLAVVFGYSIWKVVLKQRASKNDMFRLRQYTSKKGDLRNFEDL